jgi:hypothetical protein
MTTQPLPVADIGDDFIGVIHNSCPLELCDQLKEYFDIYNAKDGFTYNRQLTEPVNKLDKDDTSLSVTGFNLVHEVNIRQVGYLFCRSFWPNCYAPYLDKFNILKSLSEHKVIDMKLQKTLPGQGYHIWHCETSSRELSNRILSFILYLNDVEEGGETEFLYQKRRVKPTKGTCVLWPASFTHVHRGNPPLSNEKYVLTGWVEF